MLSSSVRAEFSSADGLFVSPRKKFRTRGGLGFSGVHAVGMVEPAESGTNGLSIFIAEWQLPQFLSLCL